MKIIEIPLTFLRDYTTPMADPADWDRNRAAILPLTLPISFFYLQKFLTPDDPQPYLWICAGLAPFGLAAGIYIRCRTTITRPPPTIMTIYAVLGFVMAISWISFTSDIVINIL